MSLVEVLVAAAVVSVGVLAALSAMAIGFDGIEAAHRSSVALFLADCNVGYQFAAARQQRHA